MAADPIATNAARHGRRPRTHVVTIFDHRVIATVTRRSADVRTWLYHTRRIHAHHLRSLIVGLGVQWRQNLRPGYPSPPAATVQLCVGRRCLIFQLHHARSVPARLIRFLSDTDVTFASVGYKHDCSMLALAGLVVARGVEIRNLAKGVMGRWNVSMEDLAKVVLGFYGVNKPHWIGRSDWQSKKLSREQIQYACVDAYIAFRLGLHLLG